MQAVAAELSGYAGKIPLLFGREEFQTACFDSLIFERGSWTDVERLFKSFLARNELIASPGV
jgi:hypothetical protein